MWNSLQAEDIQGWKCFCLGEKLQGVKSCFVPSPLATCKEESLSAEWEEEASAGAKGANLSHGWGRKHEAEQIPPEGCWDASCWHTIRNQRATTNEVVFEARGNYSLYLFSLFEHWWNKCTTCRVCMHASKYAALHHGPQLGERRERGDQWFGAPASHVAQSWCRCRETALRFMLKLKLHL